MRDLITWLGGWMVKGESVCTEHPLKYKQDKNAPERQCTGLYLSTLDAFLKTLQQ